MWQGISDTSAWLWNKISGLFNGIVDKIKDFFGIHSPSTLFAGLGGFMAEGLGIGFSDEMKDISKQMQSAIPSDFDINARTHIKGIASDSILDSPVYAFPADGGQTIVNVPLYLDGKMITSATSAVQSRRNTSYRRALGVN